MRPLQELIGRYLELYFQAEEGGLRQYKRYIYGAGRPHLSFEQLRQAAVPLPPFEEMNIITERAEALFSDLAVLEQELVTAATKSVPLRQSILTAALAGKLVPQDPADEPASALLERIRAERAAAGAAGAPRRRGRRAAVAPA